MHKLNVEGFLEIIFKMYIIKKIVDRDEVSLSLHLLIHINSIVLSYLIKLIHSRFGRRILLYKGILFFL